MDFDLSEEQQEIQRTARELLRTRVTSERLRRSAEDVTPDAELWREISHLGWPGIAIGAQYGGAGLGLVELCVLLEEAGASLAPAPLLETACAAAVIARAGTDGQRERWLPQLAGGGVTGAVGAALRYGDALVAGPRDAAVVVHFDGQDAWLSEAASTDTYMQTIDPLRQYRRMGDLGERLPGDVESAFAEVAIAVAAELTGVCQRALETTTAYVQERRQFGVPVGSFQAVAHRCAEMLLATESARSATYYAAWTADSDLDRLSEASALAKLTASAAGVDVTSSAIQAHGGIGFTWEADVHWWYKRAQMSAQLFGGAGFHRERLAAIIAQQHDRGAQLLSTKVQV